MKNEDINVHDKFYKFSSMLSEYDNFIDKYVDSITDVFVDGVLNISNVLKLDKVIIFRIINRMFEYYYGDKLYCINDKHVELVYKLIYSSKPNCFVYLPNGFRCVRSYNELRFIKNNDVKDGKKYIRRERSYSKYERSFYLGDCDEDNIDASYKNGTSNTSVFGDFKL